MLQKYAYIQLYATISMVDVDIFLNLQQCHIDVYILELTKVNYPLLIIGNCISKATNNDAMYRNKDLYNIS